MIWFLVFALFVLFADQMSKLYIVQLYHHNARLVHGIMLIKHVLYIDLVYNTGIAFGFLGDFSPYFFIIVNSLIILYILVTLFLSHGDGHSLAYYAAFGLIVGGALGNLLDRVRLGHVVDFIKVYLSRTYSWPVFNLADSAISIGIGLVIVDCFFIRKEKTHASSAA